MQVAHASPGASNGKAHWRPAVVVALSGADSLMLVRKIQNLACKRLFSETHHTSPRRVMRLLNQLGTSRANRIYLDTAAVAIACAWPRTELDALAKKHFALFSKWKTVRAQFEIAIGYFAAAVIASLIAYAFGPFKIGSIDSSNLFSNSLPLIHIIRGTVSVLIAIFSFIIDIPSEVMAHSLIPLSALFTASVLGTLVSDAAITLNASLDWAVRTVLGLTNPTFHANASAMAESASDVRTTSPVVKFPAPFDF